MNANYFFINKILSHQHIKEINQIANNNKVSKFKDIPASAKKKVNVYGVLLYYLKPHLQNIINQVLQINKKEIGYNLYPLIDSDILLINSYHSKNKGEYRWHTDGSNGAIGFDIKLTVLINISSEPYKGGEFEIFTSEKPETVKEFSDPGDVIIFRSSLLHRVKPVTFGERRSIALFFTGPKFN